MWGFGGCPTVQKYQHTRNLAQKLHPLQAKEGGPNTERDEMAYRLP